MKQSMLRNTHLRQQLFTILLTSDKPLSIQELAPMIRNAHFVSVYRSVDALRKADIIKLVPQGFKNLFELSDAFKPHHHHATCENCGVTTEVRAPELENLMKQLSIKAGLTPTKHHFELYGVCKNC
jgi:Fe2+ or Zn2+ uptake regulation protein